MENILDTKLIWDRTTGEHIEMPERMRKFIEDIDVVCKKYGLSISHEDYYGAFEVEDYKDSNINWMYNAFKNYVD